MRQFKPGEKVVVHSTDVLGTILFGTVRDCEPYFVEGRQDFDITVVLENGMVINSCSFVCMISSVERYAYLLRMMIEDFQERLRKCEMVLGHSVTEEEKQECQPSDTV